MSTFLVGLMVAVATGLVVRVALSDPEQPATIRRVPSRDRRRRTGTGRTGTGPRPGSRHRRPAGRPTTTPRHTPLRGRARPRREPARGWVRVRSGFALVILVTFVGVLMAVTMGAGLALAARALRSAVG